MKYKKKAALVETIIWDGNNLEGVLAFTGKSENFDKYFNSFKQYEDFVKQDNNVFKIFTSDGSVYCANIGDIIIKDKFGMCYPCKPDLFQMTYDKVED